MSLRNNLITNTDFYKASHFEQDPPGTLIKEYYIESRGGKYDYMLFFGLQAFIKEYLMKPITAADIDEAEEIFLASGLPFNRKGWEYIYVKYHGYMPVEIRAAKEGSKIPNHNVMVTIRATDPKVFWLAGYLETAILRAVWYPSTVATISDSIKQHIKAALLKSGGIEGLAYMLNDFGARGVSALESSQIGGGSHLVSFSGTDNVEAVRWVREYYNHKLEPASIPAAEHSTITAWGRAGELKAYANMIQKFLKKPGDRVAIVSDSYDYWNALVNLHGTALHDDIIQSGGILVVRPDSGDPATVVLRTLRILEEKFGTTTNIQGYKVLNNVRVIQGDGINEDTIIEIMSTIMAEKYSVENVCFGMGGALLQQLNRDTNKWAMKCSSITVLKDGREEERGVFKDPITDPGKRSKQGRQMLYQDPTGKYWTKAIDAPSYAHRPGPSKEALDIVYRNSVIHRFQSFDNVREIANAS